MCTAIQSTRAPQRPPLAHLRRRRALMIMELLRQTYRAHFKQASDRVLASLAMKIERILQRTYPDDCANCQTQEMLEDKLKNVIERILLGKEQPPKSSNKHSLATLLN